MTIVLTNDDGIDAPGIATLREIVPDHERVVVVAPAEEQSGISHRVTVDRDIRVDREGEDRYRVHGTPADCVRLAVFHLVPDVRTVLAGINRGGNLGVDVFLSGTVAAAREAALLGRSAVAISQVIGRARTPNWDHTRERAGSVLRELLDETTPAGVFWNVNLPHPPDDQTDCPIVRCQVDSNPLLLNYHERGGTSGTEWGFRYRGAYHDRPRTTGHDVDVCFSGSIAVTAIDVATPFAARGDARGTQ